MAYEEITKSSIRENLFETFYQVLNANKLGGWTVLASFPEQNPVFPCLVINPAAVSLKSLNIPKSKFRWAASMLVDVYSLTKDGKEKNDQGMDNVMDTIRTNLTSGDNISQYNLTLDKDVPFDDAGASQEVINDTGLNVNSLTINLAVKL
jgi:hypothetical protein